VRKGDDLTTFMCRVSRNSGALTCQNPKGLWGSFFTVATLLFNIHFSIYFRLHVGFLPGFPPNIMYLLLLTRARCPPNPTVPTCWSAEYKYGCFCRNGLPGVCSS